jgi:hypothetical protein
MMDDFVGCITVEVADPELGLSFAMVVLYPSGTAGKMELWGFMSWKWRSMRP